MSENSQTKMSNNEVQLDKEEKEAVESTDIKFRDEQVKTLQLLIEYLTLVF